MNTLKELLYLLEERLVEHDNSRKEVQRELQETCAEIEKDADLLEEKFSGEIHENFSKREERILGLIAELNGGGNLDKLLKEALGELVKEWKCDIEHPKRAKSSVDSFKLSISTAGPEKEIPIDGSNKTESIVKLLEEHLDKIHESKMRAEDKLAEMCNETRKKAEELGKRVNGELETVYSQEDARIQSVVKLVREKMEDGSPEVLEEMIRKAKAVLCRKQTYSLRYPPNKHLLVNKLRVKREALLNIICFEERKPTDLITSFTDKGELSLSFPLFSEDEAKVLKDVDSPFKVEVKVWDKGQGEGTSRALTKEFTLGEPIRLRSSFTINTTYCLKMRIVHKGKSTQWSDEAEFATSDFRECSIWKECPDNLDEIRKYSVDEKNPRIATNVGGGWCTIIGSTPLSLNKVTSWSIRILKSKSINANGIWVGVAPSDINQNEDHNYYKCGWYFHCDTSLLCSGPPHKYQWKVYGPRKGEGEYVHTGDSVGVVMDTAKGELSFVVGGVNLGVACEGIPLDKPLVPCVILLNGGDSVELII